MLASLNTAVTLSCPRCRQRGVAASLQPAQVLQASGGFVLEGFFGCSSCPAHYPIVAGVPIILREAAAWWHDCRDPLCQPACASPELRRYFAGLTAASAEQQAQERLLGSYLDSHYGSTPAPPPLPDPAVYWERLAGLAADPAPGQALELGCATGRYTFELARLSELAIGIDLNFALVAAAARIQREQAISFPPRPDSPYPAPQNVLFMVADALDPPFQAGAFSRIAALNLLDNVTQPLLLLQQLDALLAGGGHLILASPYAWRADICPPEQWLESAELDAAGTLRQLLTGRLLPELGLDYALAREQPAVPWVLRQHERAWQLFLVDLLSARKR